MCYSHLGNGVHNGAIAIKKWSFISNNSKVKPIGQWGKILVMAMGFVNHLELCPPKPCLSKINPLILTSQ
jgi:hypothetical protein